MIAERLARTSTFQVLVTSRLMPPTPYLRKIGNFPCAYSWNLAGTAYVYTRYDLLTAPALCLSEFFSDPEQGLAWLPHMHHVHVSIVAEEQVPWGHRAGEQN